MLYFSEGVVGKERSHLTSPLGRLFKTYQSHNKVLVIAFHMQPGLQLVSPVKRNSVLK